MIKTLSLILYIILTVIIIVYIDNGIRSHNMNFYHGKDNGYFVRFESIVVLNTIFYLLLSIGKSRKIMNYFKHAVAGFIIAIGLSVICYLMFLGADYYGLTFHIVTIVACYLSYFGLKKLKQILTKKKQH